VAVVADFRPDSGAEKFVAFVPDPALWAAVFAP
jgi:hypothetical protein